MKSSVTCAAGKRERVLYIFQIRHIILSLTDSSILTPEGGACV